MALSAEEVRRIARLARLELTEEEVEACRRDLSRILAYAEGLREVPTEGVEPSAHVLDLSNVWREDRPGAPLGADVAASGAPEAAGGCFRVPRVIEE